MRDLTFRFRGSVMPAPGVRASALAPSADGEPGVQTLRLYDPIDSWGGDWGVSAKEFAAALSSLPADTTEIRLHINSPGGEVFEAVAILNQLRAHPARVVTIVDGLAASAASFIATGADETVMGRNAQLMIHDAWGLCVGNAGDMRGLADLLDRLSNNIADVYAAKAGGTVEDWRTAMLAESWYSADEAVAAGLADGVASVPDAPAASFDTKGFKYASRSNAPGPVLPVTPAAGFPQRRRDGLNAARRRLT